MKPRLSLLACLALIALVGCDNNPARVLKSENAALPTVDGCTIERFEVHPFINTLPEAVYIARCTPVQTTSVTSQSSCGKGCKKKVTTVTTIEGVEQETK